MGDHHDARLVCDALESAVATRSQQRMDDTIFHSDRGSEYTSTACMRRSLGRTGSCLDNAVAESWFATLKVELVDRCHYHTRAEARASIFRWIAWYNRRRLHSANDYLPPLEWELRHRHDHQQFRREGIPVCGLPQGVHRLEVRVDVRQSGQRGECSGGERQ